MPLEELTETTFTLVAEHMTLAQIIDAVEGLIQLASHPTRPKTAPPMPVDELQALLEKVIDFRDWQELEEQDDRDDTQKLIDNATGPDTVLVRDPSGTPELQEIGILELLQRYPCRGSEARRSPDDAIAILETKTRWLDAALESWDADGEAMADDSDLIEAKAVVLVVPAEPAQPMRTELLDVLIPVEESTTGRLWFRRIRRRLPWRAGNGSAGSLGDCTKPAADQTAAVRTAGPPCRMPNTSRATNRLRQRMISFIVRPSAVRRST